MYSNLKRYDEKGRRVSIFAREIEVLENNFPRRKLEMFIQTSSKKDSFNRTYSKLRAEYYFEKGPREFRIAYPYDRPQIFTIDVEENKPKITFLNWCKRNYYHLETNELITPKKGEVVSVGKSKKVLVKILKK